MDEAQEKFIDRYCDYVKYVMEKYPDIHKECMDYLDKKENSKV